MKRNINIKLALPLTVLSIISIATTIQMDIKLQVVGIMVPVYAFVLPLFCLFLYLFLNKLPKNKKFPTIFLKITSSLFIIFMFYFWCIPLFIINSQKAQIQNQASDINKHKVAIVFGAGVYKDGTPMPVLEDRLSIAADLYHKDKIEIILLSGDNRFDHYNEPEAMKRYLVEEKTIPENDILMDFAGRRTFDTCKRANQLWNVNRAVLVTQEYHLYRATLLCDDVGMKSTGIDAAIRDYEGNFIYKTRELFALHKAVIDLYVKEPDYVGGEFEQDLSDLD